MLRHAAGGDARSPAAISARLPPRCSVTASRDSGFVHGTGPSRAKSTLPTPSPNRNRPSSRRSGAGMRRPAMRSSAGTLVSNSTTEAAGRSAGPRSVAAGLDPPAVRDEVRGERVDDRLAAAEGHRPAAGVRR